MPLIVFSLSLSSLLLASLLPPRPRPLKPIFINANNPITRISAGPLRRLKSQPMPPSTSLSAGRGRLFWSTKTLVRGDKEAELEEEARRPRLSESAPDTTTTMKAGAPVASVPLWRGEAMNSHRAATPRLSVTAATATRGTNEPRATPGAAAPADPTAAVRLKAVSEQAAAAAAATAAAAAAAAAVAGSVFAVLGAWCCSHKRYRPTS